MERRPRHASTWLVVAAGAAVVAGAAALLWFWFGRAPLAPPGNAQAVPTPVGEVTVQTDGTLFYPGGPVGLVLRARPGAVTAIDGVRYSLAQRGGPAVAAGESAVPWAPQEGDVEARLPNLFPQPEADPKLGREFPEGDYELVVELLAGGRTMGKASPLAFRIERWKKDY
jgi:hypothetical protein